MSLWVDREHECCRYFLLVKQSAAFRVHRTVHRAGPSFNSPGEEGWVRSMELSSHIPDERHEPPVQRPELASGTNGTQI